jgi:hypothetical protein
MTCLNKVLRLDRPALLAPSLLISRVHSVHEIGSFGQAYYTSHVSGLTLRSMRGTADRV